MLAWRMYVDSSNDTLPPAWNNLYKQPTADGRPWITGSLDFSAGNTSNTDINRDITRSLLWPYCGKSPGIWKCPADQSTVYSPSTVSFLPRVRSISMNGWLGSTDVAGYSSGNYRIFEKGHKIVNPSMTWAFLDEREDSINDGELVVSMNGCDPAAASARMIVDYPASYHCGSCGVSFTDGHAEIHKWRDPRTTPALNKGQPLSHVVSSPDNIDVLWLQQRSTVPQ